MPYIRIFSHGNNNKIILARVARSNNKTFTARMAVGSGSTRSPWVRKPLWAAANPNAVEGGPGDHLARHLTLFDLICVGVGATVGSGIFVLCGLIAHSYAGPATFISWAVAGTAACLSGLCYAELAGRFPSAGSSYAYAFISMGELVAYIAGACLTLEYVFSASAVARSWGDKVIEYAKANISEEEDHPLLAFLEPGALFNPFAFIISTLAVALHLKGVRESKSATNFFSLVKVALVIFMTVTSFFLLEPENLTPLVPPEFGIGGIFRGASTLFFGYIGYDEICCVAGEAINPKKNLPRAVIASLAAVTVLYILAAIALTGMVPYEEISETSPFPNGFRYRGLEWASHLSAIGELVTLPLVVLVSIMAQPRLQYAMAQDGLLPPIFAALDANGGLWWGTLISGSFMVIIATFIPFTYLNDLISAGILIAFNMTDASVILLRNKRQGSNPYLLEKLLALFNFLAILSGILTSYWLHTFEGRFFAGAIALVLISVGVRIHKKFDQDSDVYEKEGFRTPFVPFLPLLGATVNWYLIAHLSIFSLLLLGGYLLIAAASYFLYSSKHSVANTTGWRRSEGGETDELEQYEMKNTTSAHSHKLI